MNWWRRFAPRWKKFPKPTSFCMSATPRIPIRPRNKRMFSGVLAEMEIVTARSTPIGARSRMIEVMNKADLMGGGSPGL